jgi:hypothetical protein
MPDRHAMKWGSPVLPAVSLVPIESAQSPGVSGRLEEMSPPGHFDRITPMSCES